MVEHGQNCVLMIFFHKRKMDLKLYKDEKRLVGSSVAKAMVH